jgi:hypothetical protein
MSLGILIYKIAFKVSNYLDNTFAKANILLKK